MGRVSQGVRGMKLRENDRVVAMVVVKRGGTILAISENGYGKRSSIDEYSVKGRNIRGVITIKTNERNGKLVSLLEVIDSDDLMIVTRNGLVIRQDVGALRVQGRNTAGVKLINLLEEDSVHDITCVHDESEMINDELIEAVEKRHAQHEEFENGDDKELNQMVDEEEEA
jgi:DNA gyrase subunit A